MLADVIDPESGAPGCAHVHPLRERSLSSACLFPERTLMLPLTEGSLRLRADDEDSLTSEDSFFSATEVTRAADGCSGVGRVKARLLCDPRGEHWVMGKWNCLLQREQKLAVTKCCSPGIPYTCWGQGGLRSQGSQVLRVRSGFSTHTSSSHGNFPLLQTACLLLGFWSHLSGPAVLAWGGRVWRQVQ